MLFTWKFQELNLRFIRRCHLQIKHLPATRMRAMDVILSVCNVLVFTSVIALCDA